MRADRNKGECSQQSQPYEKSRSRERCKPTRSAISRCDCHESLVRNAGWPLTRITPRTRLARNNGIQRAQAFSPMARQGDVNRVVPCFEAFWLNTSGVGAEEGKVACETRWAGGRVRMRRACGRDARVGGRDGGKTGGFACASQQQDTHLGRLTDSRQAARVSCIPAFP